MREGISPIIRPGIGGDEQRIHSRDTRYLLLPVWIGAKARTGQVQGDRPYSARKIGLLVVAILLAIAVLA